MKSVRSILAVMAMVLLSTTGGFSSERCVDWVAKLVSVQGTVEVRRSEAANWAPVQLEDTLCAGDTVRVMDHSRAALVLPNDAVVRLDQQTTVSITPPEEKPSYLLNLVKGAVHFFSRVPRSLRILTPFVNGTIEGTEVALTAIGSESTVSVIEGKLRIENDLGDLLLASGDSARVQKDRAPANDPSIVAADQIRWALYYPPVIGLGGKGPVEGLDMDLSDRLTRAQSAFERGDTAEAFHLLSIEDAPVTAPGFFAFRASLLLFVGRVDEAGQDIRTLRVIDPESADADVLEAIVATAQNRKDDALRLADSAVDKAPRSAAAHIALSYARQASFDIQGAEDAVATAIEVDPDNGLAWARQAELQLSLGEVENAGRSSDRAAELVPELSRVQMVKGFTLLARIRIDEAVQTFYAAVAQDSAAPLPRLGLGLAQIRLGSLAMGRQNIEIAAALDPDNALVRSYLGKAYYEEKRDSEAETQYALAKSLDPGDPTPFFYDAIRKQTGNRPVDALKDIQQAIKLNDNRAVYRSRFLLDQDLAARSAAQGRIYGDLGFQQLALVEGYTSVNTAPGNFSAHRFLADNYAAKPRHEIARVSELLQSQMLQPLNVTPLQPQLSVSNLGIIEGSGPSGLSFSEFNPLFTRNRLTLQANGVVGNKDTWGEEIVHAGLLNNLSYSFGQFHFETDGFRKNNHQEQNLYNGFLQLALDHRTQVQSELRIRHIDREDPEILFDPDSFSENQKEDNDSTTLRLGIHHQLSPGSDLLLSFIAEDNDIEINDRDGTVDIDIHSQFDDGKSIEGQHIFDSTTLNLVSGVGYASTPEDRDTVVDVKDPFFPVSDDVSEHFQVDSANIYTYSHWSFGDALTAIAGLSIDTVQRDWKYSDDFTTPFPPLNASTKDDDSSDRTKVNPKLGIIWNPLSSTTVRIAGFRHLSRTLVGDQTIEPTQVAGFNQFFDDFDGTDIWVAGAAIDHRFTDTLFSGIEYYHRWLDVDYEVIEGGAVRFDDDDWREQVASAYLYWAPHSMVSARLEYLFEKFDDRDDFQGVGNFIELKTHRLKMGGGLFLPCGLFARFQTTYVDQRGDFVDSDALPTGRDSDDFWVTDAALGYRLPKRYGTLSVEALNLFDESFKFQDTDPATPTIAPERWLLVKLSLNF